MRAAPVLMMLTAGDPVFNAVHDLAVGRDGSIDVAEARAKRVVKLWRVSRASIR